MQGPEWQSKGGKEGKRKERARRLYSCGRGGRDKAALRLASVWPADKGFRESPDEVQSSRSGVSGVPRRQQGWKGGNRWQRHLT